MNGEIEVGNSELSRSVVEGAERQFGSDFESMSVAVGGAIPSRSIPGRVTLRESGESERQIGERVDTGAHGSEERRSGSRDGVSCIDLVRLVGGRGVGSSGGGDVDVVGDLDEPGKNESIATVETLDRSEEMLEILSSRRVQIDVVEFEPVEKVSAIRWSRCDARN